MLERRKLIGVVVGLAVLPVGWALWQVVDGGEGGARGDWRTDAGPLVQAFPQLGPLTGAQWVSSR